MAHRAYPEFARTFLPQGRAPAAGETFRCLEQAETLEAIAATDGTLDQRLAAIALTIAVVGYILFVMKPFDKA